VEIFAPRDVHRDECRRIFHTRANSSRQHRAHDLHSFADDNYYYYTELYENRDARCDGHGDTRAANSSLSSLCLLLQTAICRISDCWGLVEAYRLVSRALIRSDDTANPPADAGKWCVLGHQPYSSRGMHTWSQLLSPQSSQSAFLSCDDPVFRDISDFTIHARNDASAREQLINGTGTGGSNSIYVNKWPILINDYLIA